MNRTRPGIDRSGARRVTRRGNHPDSFNQLRLEGSLRLQHGGRPLVLRARGSHQPPRMALGGFTLLLALITALAGAAILREIDAHERAEKPAAIPSIAEASRRAANERLRADVEVDAEEKSYRSGRAAPYAWARHHALVADDMGIVGGVSHSNSAEAFEHNYRLGYRLFSVGFLFTRDDVLVARGDWKKETFRRFDQPIPKGNIPSFAEFKQSPIDGYTPLSAKDVIRLMRRHPDAFVIADFGDLDPNERGAAAQHLLKAARGQGQGVRSRLIVEIYAEGEFAPLAQMGVSNVVYSFRTLSTSESRALRFARQNEIGVIAVPHEKAKRALVSRIRAQGLLCAVEHVNDEAAAQELRKRHVSLVYSESLQPARFEVE